jgi:thiamine-phosphate pyrophosphorylase
MIKLSYVAVSLVVRTGYVDPVNNRERRAASTLYLCTDARRDTADLAEFADAALAGGVDVIQLRDKGSEGDRAVDP